jgi:TRAP-type C4-dicarboxylate transport system permease large subunit
VKDVIKPIDEALRTACMVLVLVACSNVFGHFLTITDIPALAAQWTADLTINRNIVLIFVLLIYLIGGSFIDDLAFGCYRCSIRLCSNWDLTPSGLQLW